MLASERWPARVWHPSGGGWHFPSPEGQGCKLAFGKPGGCTAVPHGPQVLGQGQEGQTCKHSGIPRACSSPWGSRVWAGADQEFGMRPSATVDTRNRAAACEGCHHGSSQGCSVAQGLVIRTHAVERLNPCRPAHSARPPYPPRSPDTLDNLWPHRHPPWPATYPPRSPDIAWCGHAGVLGHPGQQRGV